MSTDRSPDQERLVSVLRQVPAFVAMLHGPDHVFTVANPAYLELIQNRNPIGRPVREVLPEIENQGFIEILDHVYRTGERFVGTEVPVRLRAHPGGEWQERYLNFVYQPDRTEPGAVHGVIVHGVDVTEQVQARRTAEEQAEELQQQAALLEEAQEDLRAVNRRLADASRDAEESRARLEAVIEQMPSGVLIASAPHGDVVLANRQVQAIWRRSPPAEGSDGWDGFVAIRPDGSRYLQGEWPLDRARRGESVRNEEMEILLPDGSRAVISVSSAPVRDRNGEVVAAVAVFDDVTERWRHEHEQAFLVEAARILASSLDYHETLRSVARIAVPRIGDWCAVDMVENGVPRRLAVVHTDPEKERLAAEVAKRWPADPEARFGVPQVLRSGESELYTEVSSELVEAAARDQEHLELLREIGIRSAMIVPMVARGRTLGAISFISAESGRGYDAGDLRAAEKLASRAAMAIDNALLFRQAEHSRKEAETAQRRAEEARQVAEVANHAKSEFLANMSHEMRTPLNAITGYIELLQMEIAGPLTEQQKGQLERTARSAQHLLTLINDLLDLARIESGRLRVHEEAYPAAEAVEAAVALVGPQAAERQLKVESECPEGTGPRYVGDRDRVRQILVNLLGNAVKFTRPGGSVTVSCGRAGLGPSEALEQEGGPWTFIRVEDTGVGIESTELQRIFRPFEQVQGGYTREAEGAGLGLSISRQLALLMGGDLTAQSTPGKGSTFTLWLPSAAPAGLVELGAAAEPSGLAEVGNALLADVEPTLERYVARMRSDPDIPLARRFNEAELLDHHSSLLSDIASTLTVLDEPGAGGVRVLQDSSEIQRLLSELHGRQRSQLGWSEAALKREFEILREELHAAVPEAGVGDDSRVPRRAAEVIDHVLGMARRISLRAFRAARAGAVPPPP